jgi:hypothetical protein
MTSSKPAPPRTQGPMGITIRCGQCRRIGNTATWSTDCTVGSEGKCEACGAVCARVVPDGIEPYGSGELVEKL